MGSEMCIRDSFQIVSSDGHATKGMTSFSYQPDDAGSQSQQDSTATNAAETNENSSVSALWLLALGTIVLAVIAVLAVTNRSKKSKTITDDVRKGAQ